MPAETILILGGTAESVSLAKRIAEERPTDRLIVSLAGRTKEPIVPHGEVRTGGFGGADGLAAYLLAETVTRLVDATHPFAVGMSRNAARACEAASVPRVVLARPAWVEVPGETWVKADCLAAARDALPVGARPLLALGRQHLSPFAARTDLSPVLRTVDAPDAPLPFPAEVIVGRPSPGWREEAELLLRLRVTHVVCRNSGGTISYAKVEAARHLGLPVIMIERAEAPPPPTVASIAEVMAWL